MIRPLRDLLVLRPLAPPGRRGRIFIPDLGTSGNKTAAVCEVLAVGPGWRDQHYQGKNKGLYKSQFNQMTVKVGDRVSVAAYGSHLAGEEVLHEGETLTIIRERDINGRIEA